MSTVDPVATVEIDKALCSGSGFCLSVAPDVFSMLPGEQQATVAVEQARGEHLELAREAESMCPLGAIRVEPIG